MMSCSGQGPSTGQPKGCGAVGQTSTHAIWVFTQMTRPQNVYLRLGTDWTFLKRSPLDVMSNLTTSCPNFHASVKKSDDALPVRPIKFLRASASFAISIVLGQGQVSQRLLNLLQRSRVESTTP